MGDTTSFLRTTTLVVDLFGLASAVWLGLYVVTNNPRRRLAWLTALALWSAAGVFLNGLLALNPPPEDLPRFVRVVLPFWPPRAGVGEDARFFHQGWAVTPAVIFWHHATLLVRPEEMDRRRRLRVVLGYLIALSAILVQAYAPHLFTTAAGDTLYHDITRAGPLYPVFAVALLIYLGLCISNLSTSASATKNPVLQGQLRTLARGTLLAGSLAPLYVVSTVLRLRTPLLVDSMLLAAGILWIGYGVVRYSAFLEGRVISRDFVYQAAAIGIVTLLYLLVTWFSVGTYQVPSAAFTFIVVLAIITHSLVGSGRSLLDSLFFRSDALRLRRVLRRLTNLAGEQEDLEVRLTRPLEALCRSINATYGLVYLGGDGQAQVKSSFGWDRSPPPSFPLSSLAEDDLAPVKGTRFREPLADVCLLSPLYIETLQVGALLLGCPKDALGFNQADLDLIAHVSDRLADVFRNSREQQIHLERMEALVQAGQPEADSSGEITAQAVENALRNLFDFAYLGNHPLARRSSVGRFLPAGDVTHLDRGKALHNLMADAIERFRPQPGRPSDPPPREWHPYVILHSAYVEGTPNRDIMSRLYISEGTFNRTRRAAIHALARALDEMEPSPATD